MDRFVLRPRHNRRAGLAAPRDDFGVGFAAYPRRGDIVELLDFENGFGRLPPRTGCSLDQHNAKSRMINDLFKAVVREQLSFLRIAAVCCSTGRFDSASLRVHVAKSPENQELL